MANYLYNMNLQEQISRIQEMMVMNETENKNIIWLHRRLNSPMINGYFLHEISHLEDEISPCGYNDFEKYFSEVLEVLSSNFISSFDDNLYDDDDMLEIDKAVNNFITFKYKDYFQNQFDGKICDEE
jgi:hypothetical protein